MNTYGGALLVVALIAGVWWLLGSGDAKPEQKGKSKVAMVFRGLVAAWAIKNRHRFPLRWQLAGGLALAAALAFVFDVPEIAWPVLAATVALATVNVVRPPQRSAPAPSDQLARDWPAMIEASPALTPVLKGSTVTRVERDKIGRTVHVKLAGGRTAAEVRRLASNLDALFEARVGWGAGPGRSRGRAPGAAAGAAEGSARAVDRLAGVRLRAASPIRCRSASTSRDRWCGSTCSVSTSWSPA